MLFTQNIIEISSISLYLSYENWCICMIGFCESDYLVILASFMEKEIYKWTVFQDFSLFVVINHSVIQLYHQGISLKSKFTWKIWNRRGFKITPRNLHFLLGKTLDIPLLFPIDKFFQFLFDKYIAIGVTSLNIYYILCISFWIICIFFSTSPIAFKNLNV